MAFPNLQETGPLVFEVPAGPTAGGFTDFWQRPITVWDRPDRTRARAAGI
ncbi:MAG: hypothetical protein ACK54F_03790 [Planctomycetia bacterium]